MQPTDERYGDNVFIAIVHLGHLTLEVADIIFQALPWFHFHYEEMVTILLEFSSGSELVAEGISYIFKVSEGILWE